MKSEKRVASAKEKDQEVIQQLIRRVIKWADEESSLSYLPTRKNDTARFHLGLDMDEHSRSLKKMEDTNFFSKEFLDNYDKIHRNY